MSVLTHNSNLSIIIITLLNDLQGHKVGLEFERLLRPPASSSASVTSSSFNSDSEPPAAKQPRVDTSLHKQAAAAYQKLLKTAYILAVDGLPLKTFSSFVKVQKANGVQLIQGTESGDKAKEFIGEIAKTIRQKIDTILKTSTAFSVLSDGSQARKTGSEKELVYIRTATSGKPVSYLAGCQNIDYYGDANAGNLKSAVDDVFKKTLHLDETEYRVGLVSSTADGAAVNFGRYSGLLTRMKMSRPWLLTIHCVNHRTELAVKDSLQTIKVFRDIEDVMTNLYYMMKRSGKLKRHLESLGKVQEVQVFKFGKIHGTRFVSHHRRGVNVLIHNWLPLLQVLENSLANQGGRGGSDAKLRGVLKKLRNVRFLSASCVYKEILEILSRLSLQFEKDELLIFEVLPALEEAKSRLEELEESATASLPLESAGFTLDGQEVHCRLPKPGHMRKKVENREYTDLTYSKMTNYEEDLKSQVSNLKSAAVPLVVQTLDSRFKSFAEDDLIQNTRWIDPANWKEKPEEDLQSMMLLAERFETTLAAHGFSAKQVPREWKDLRITVRNYYAGVNAHILWQRIATYRQMQFRNILMLVDIILSLGSSNSVVERGFSILTGMMSDRRLSLKHETLEDLLMVKVNRGLSKSRMRYCKEHWIVTWVRGEN